MTRSNPVNLPVAIEAGLNPGGLVSRVYAPDGSVLDEALLVDDASCEEAARTQALLVIKGQGRAGVWDGDSGALRSVASQPSSRCSRARR